MLMNTTFLGDSFSIKWQSRVIAKKQKKWEAIFPIPSVFLINTDSK